MDDIMKFTWRIDDFPSTAPREQTFPLMSKKFYVTGTQLQLFLEFCPCDRQFRKQSTLFLTLASPLTDTQLLTLFYRLWVENSTGRKIDGFGRKHTFCTGDLSTGIALNPDDLYPPESDFAKEDGMVFMCCEIHYDIDENPERTPPESAYWKVDFRRKLFTLYQSGYSEVCTVWVGLDHVPIARNQLMANSEVFEQAFKSSKKAARMNQIEVSGFSLRAIDVFIEYAYTHKLHDVGELALELLKVAETFKVAGDIKEQCFQELCRTLTSENILSRLIIAFANDYDGLKRGVLEYIAKDKSINLLRLILTSDEWRELFTHDKKLADQILNAILEQFQ